MFVVYCYLFVLQCLLNDQEIEIKTKLWMEENKDYLQKLKGELDISISIHGLQIAKIATNMNLQYFYKYKRNQVLSAFSLYPQKFSKNTLKNTRILFHGRGSKSTNSKQTHVIFCHLFFQFHTLMVVILDFSTLSSTPWEFIVE